MKKFGLRVLGVVAVATIGYWGTVWSMDAERTLLMMNLSDRGAPTSPVSFGRQQSYGLTNNAAPLYHAACVLALNVNEEYDSSQKREALVQLMLEASEQRRCVYRSDSSGYNYDDIHGYTRLLDIVCQEIRGKVERGELAEAKTTARSILKFVSSLKQLRGVAGHGVFTKAVERARAAIAPLQMDGFEHEWSSLAADIEKDRIDSLEEECVMSLVWLDQGRDDDASWEWELARTQLRIVKQSAPLIESTKVDDSKGVSNAAADFAAWGGPRSFSEWPKVLKKSQSLVAGLREAQ